MGWQRAHKEPDLAIKLTLEDYGADLGLNPESQELELKDQTALQISDATEAKGLFYMSDEDIEKNLKVLADLDLKIDASFYSNEILDEVYADGIDLLG